MRLNSIVAASVAAAIDQATLRIVHWNDQHAHWAEYHKSSSALCRTSETGAARSDCIGGIPRLAAFLAGRRLQTETDSVSRPTGMFVINAGDEMQGTPLWSGFGKQGEVLQAMWPHMPSDVFVVGNHEFDNGASNFVDLLKFIEGQSNVICANCKFDQGSCAVGPAPYPPDSARFCYKANGAGVMDLVDDCATADFRLGAIGVVLENMVEVAKVVDPDCQFSEPVAAVKRVLDALDSDEYDAFVLVTHTDIAVDMAISEAVFDYRTSAPTANGRDNARRVLAIFSGHSHTMMCDQGEHWGVQCTYKTPDGSRLPATYPMMRDRIPLYQDYKWTRTVGEVMVDLERISGKWQSAVRFVDDDSDLSDLVNSLAADPAAEAAIAPFMSRLEDLFNDKRCEADEDLECDTETGLCGLGVIAADAMLSHSPSNTRFMPVMSLADATKAVPRGMVTWGVLAEAFPYFNLFVYMEVTGRNLMDNIEWGLQKWEDGDFKFSFSGIRVINPQKFTRKDTCGGGSPESSLASTDGCGLKVFDEGITVHLNKCLASHLQSGGRMPYPDFGCDCWEVVEPVGLYTVVTHHYMAGDPTAGSGGWGYCWKSSSFYTDVMTVFDNILSYTRPTKKCVWSNESAETRFRTGTSGNGGYLVSSIWFAVAALFIL